MSKCLFPLPLWKCIKEIAHLYRLIRRWTNPNKGSITDHMCWQEASVLLNISESLTVLYKCNLLNPVLNRKNPCCPLGDGAFLLFNTANQPQYLENSKKPETGLKGNYDNICFVCTENVCWKLRGRWSKPGKI